MIELRDVQKRFGDNRVLQGVNLSIASGTSMVIIGGSGTGKSVLLKGILGLVRPDAGTITLDGQDVTKGDRDAFLARFGMLFQGGALFDSLRVWENVAFRLVRGPKALPKTQAREVAVEKLRRVGLKPEVADLFPAELSGGMQKRVGLARAIAAEPPRHADRQPHIGVDQPMQRAFVAMVTPGPSQRQLGLGIEHLGAHRAPGDGPCARVVECHPPTSTPNRGSVLA